ncbi:hypothetical protein FQN57_002797 [Myotisia sp. PD_48]|nr:hypothetical protein FQN57_002797 [Myotisia sp. PD_48]
MPHSTYFKEHDSKFKHNDSNTLEIEFERLATRKGWHKKGQWSKFWRLCIAAEFKYHVYQIVDADLSKLEQMQRLCTEFGVTDAEKTRSIAACNKALNKIYINLFDWIDACRRGEAPHVFRTYKQLQQYTTEMEKIFPKKIIKRFPIMKVFMKDF